MKQKLSEKIASDATVAGRTVAVRRRYTIFRKKMRKNHQCAFCNIGNQDGVNEIIYESKHFYVIKNKFPYEIFDSHKVIDHLLLVPKNHVVSLSELTPSERKSMIEILGKYEAMGYTFMGRADQNTTKSVAHQHTHLIKVV